MFDRINRRSFVSGAIASAAHFSMLRTAAAAVGSGIRLGCAAITWNDAVAQSIEDIAAVGFPGIQLRANVVKLYEPSKLKEMLAAKKLTFVALSSGDVSLDKPVADQIAYHVANAKYLKDSGGLYLQVTDSGKPWPRTVTPDECVRVGKLLTEVGKRVTDAGVALGYHNHMSSISEKPENLAIVLENSDPRYVRLELDVAHSAAGGGDPAAQIIQYRDRLLFLHLKDYVAQAPSRPGRYPFQFVELGKGKVDLPGVIAALRKAGFKGWAVAELDAVPEPNGTPKASAQINYDYLRKAGFTMR